MLQEPAGDLLGRPAVFQVFTDPGHQTAVIGLGPMQMGSPAAVRLSLSVTGIISAGNQAVAPSLSADSATMPSQTAGDLCVAIALMQHSVYDISFVHGKMVVRHREYSLV